jgi:hypothetical protein
MMFCRGDRVKTPEGCGTVAFQRLAPPDYTEAVAVSVCLDNKMHDPAYSGTIFSAYQVKILDKGAEFNGECG